LLARAGISLAAVFFYLVSFSKFYNYIFHSAPASGWWRLATVFLPLLGYEGNDGDITASLLREFGGGGGNRTETPFKLIAMAIP